MEIDVTVSTWPYKTLGGELHGFMARAERTDGESVDHWDRFSRDRAALGAFEMLRQSYPEDKHRRAAARALTKGPDN